MQPEHKKALHAALESVIKLGQGTLPIDFPALPGEELDAARAFLKGKRNCKNIRIVERQPDCPHRWWRPRK